MVETVDIVSKKTFDSISCTLIFDSVGVPKSPGGIIHVDIRGKLMSHYSFVGPTMVKSVIGRSSQACSSSIPCHLYHELLSNVSQNDSAFYIYMLKVPYLLLFLPIVGYQMLVQNILYLVLDYIHDCILGKTLCYLCNFLDSYSYSIVAYLEHLIPLFFQTRIHLFKHCYKIMFTLLISCFSRRLTCIITHFSWWWIFH